MKIAVSSSFEQLMGRVDCEVYIVSCYLAKLDSSMPEESSILINPKKDVEIGACGIWEKDTKKLKLFVRIPEDSIADSENEYERQEYAAIYFFSSRGDQGGATFAIYNYDDGAYKDLGLSLGRNLIDIEFPEEFEGRISLKDTSQDTEFLETFGQYPGKNIHITKNEDTIVSKKTYYNYWRLEVTKDRETTDLPLLDETGKMIVSNYRYRTYSNLIIDTPGLTRVTIPYTRYGLSNSGGTVSILGTADFIEYSVWGDKIKEELRGRTTIDSIPGSEIVYISGHNDSGIEVSEVHNIFSINNYSSLIDYSPKETSGRYGADGIFGLRITYYDVQEGKPVTVTSENQIRLARRSRSDSWFILNSSTRYREETEEFGSVPVYLFPYDTSGTGYFTIRTKFPTPISDLSQIQVTSEDPTLDTLFSVSPVLEPFVDIDGTYYVDIKVTLKALQENQDEKLWAPIISGSSKLLYTKISYQDYIEVFYMVQCPKIYGESLKLVDASGNTVNEVVLNYGATSQKTYYLVADPETNDLGERNGWRIIDAPENTVFFRATGILSTQVLSSYAPENTITISYAPNSITAQDIILPDIIIARLKEQGINEDLENTDNWRVMVDIVQIHVGFRKLGREIRLNITPTYSIQTGGIGLYEFKVHSNCRFKLETEDTKYIFREKWNNNNGNPLESPSYNDPRYSNLNEYFSYWIEKDIVDAVTNITLEPIIITATEGDRQVTKSLVVNQDIVSSNIFKLKENGDDYSSGQWELVVGQSRLSRLTGVGYRERSWVKQDRVKSNIPLYSPSAVYNKGDVVKSYLGLAVKEYSSSLNSVWPCLAYTTGTGNNSEWWWSNISATSPEEVAALGEPSEDNRNWTNKTQYFISLNDNNTGNVLSSGNQGNNGNWKEIASVYSLSELDNRKTIINQASNYTSEVEYKIGDIVNYNGNYYIATKGIESGIQGNSIVTCTTGGNIVVKSVSLNGGSLDNTIIQMKYMHSINTPAELRIDGGTNYNFYFRGDLVVSNPVSFGYNTGWSSGDYLRVSYNTVGSSSYYNSEVTRVDSLNINKTPTSNPTWWKNISDCQTLADVGLSSLDDSYFYRTVVVRSVGTHYTYTYDVAYLTVDESLPGSIDSVLDAIDTNSPENSPIRYLLNNPSNFIIGTSLRVVPMSTIPMSTRFEREDLFIHVNRDSKWVELDHYDSLLKILGDKYSEKYFHNNKSLIFNKSELDLRIAYSAILPQKERTRVYMMSDYVEYSSKADISIDMIPLVGTVDNLPTISILPKNSSNYRRIDDGGIVRLANFNSDMITRYKGDWVSGGSYSVGDIVSTSLGIGGNLYFVKVHVGAPDIHPETEGNSMWKSITWTEIEFVESDSGYTPVNTTGKAIEATRIRLGLNSTEGISFLDSYSQEDVNQITRDILKVEPKPGNIICAGLKYYYCGFGWNTINCPEDNLDHSEISFYSINNINDLPDLSEAYSSVIVEYTPQSGDPIYYVTNSSYLFNNIGDNQYIFVPRYSNSSTQIKFFSRKTPTETLDRPEDTSSELITVLSNIYVSQEIQPIFNESLDSNDHYTCHTMGLRYTEREIVADPNGGSDVQQPTNIETL